MRILDCRGSSRAWAAWHACADAAEHAGAGAVTEELRSEVRNVGPHVHFAGFSRWNGVAERRCLAVVVEGSGWAMDDQERVVLRAGQAAFWQPDEFSAFGGDRDMSFTLKACCRVLVVSADELSLEPLLAAAGDDASGSGALVARERSPGVAAMQVFDCGSAAAARACYDGYLAAGPPRERGMSRGGALGGGVFGGHLWNSGHLAVFVEGGGWAADNQTRQTLRPGQGAFWPAGSWFACGTDANAEIRMVGRANPSVEIPTLGRADLGVDAFLSRRPPPQ